MATEKKKVSDKKLSIKNPTDKIKSTAKKSKKNSVGDYNLLITVPKGGQVIRFFNLTPALPVGGEAGNWLFAEKGIPNPQDITNLTVGFPENPLAIEREFERAILVINMKQSPTVANGTWRFALSGVATDKTDSDPNNDVAIEIIDNGLTLIVYVHVLENSIENIDFGFVASFTDTVSGAVTIFESKDPGFQPIRPIGG